jgi:hypothetical protein
MWKSFWAALTDELGKRASLYLIVLLGSGAVGGVYWLDPLYHGGWILSYKEWLFAFIVICAIAILASQSTVGLTIVVICALLSSGGFAFLYKNPNFEHGDWPFVGWALHLLAVALIVGVFVGIGARFFQRETPPAPPRGGGGSKRGRASKEAPPATAGGKANPKTTV